MTSCSPRWPRWVDGCDGLPARDARPGPRPDLCLGGASRRGRGAGRAGGPEQWDGSDFSHLLEEARAFRRVGAGPAPIRPVSFARWRADCSGPGPMIRAVASAWLPGCRKGGAAWCSGASGCTAPWSISTSVPEPSGPRCASVSFGPAIPLALSLRNTPPVARVTVDEVALVRDQAIFTLSDDHELVFFYGVVE